jgi:hypothetical protein
MDDDDIGDDAYRSQLFTREDACIGKQRHMSLAHRQSYNTCDCQATILMKDSVLRCPSLSAALNRTQLLNSWNFPRSA